LVPLDPSFLSSSISGLYIDVSSALGTSNQPVFLSSGSIGWQSFVPSVDAFLGGISLMLMCPDTDVPLNMSLYNAADVVVSVLVAQIDNSGSDGEVFKPSETAPVRLVAGHTYRFALGSVPAGNCSVVAGEKLYSGGALKLASDPSSTTLDLVFQTLMGL
jgi:hypothetical protein